LANKPKYSRILPVVQVAITATLTFWADRIEWILIDNTRRAPGRFGRVDFIAIQAKNVWRGLNAPTFPFCFAGLSKYQILGFGVGELTYFAAVALLWFYVGRFFDWRAASVAPESPTFGMRRILFSILMIAWGLFLPFGNFWIVGRQFEVVMRPDLAIQSALFLIWSVVLIGVFARKLLRVVSST
jgi:hypothetical protein